MCRIPNGTDKQDSNAPARPLRGRNAVPTGICSSNSGVHDISQEALRWHSPLLVLPSSGLAGAEREGVREAAARRGAGRKRLATALIVHSMQVP